MVFVNKDTNDIGQIHASQMRSTNDTENDDAVSRRMAKLVLVEPRT